MTSYGNINNRYDHSDETSGRESVTPASLDDILQNMNDLIISLNSLNENIEKKERPRSNKPNLEKWKCGGVSGEVNKTNVIAGTPEINDFNWQSRSGNVIEDNCSITRPHKSDSGDMLHSKNIESFSVTNQQQTKLKQTNRRDICNYAGYAATCLHNSLPNYEIEDNNSNSSHGTVVFSDSAVQILHKFGENQDPPRKEIESGPGIKSSRTAVEYSQLNKREDTNTNYSRESDIVTQDSIEEISDKDQTRSSEPKDNYVGILRSSPTIRRKDRPQIKSRIKTKQSNQISDKREVSPEIDLKTTESKTAFKDEPTRIQLRPHRSLSIRDVFSRKFGSLRIDKSKLKSSLSAPPDSNKASIRKIPDTERYDTNVKHPSLLSCYQLSGQYNTSRKQDNFKFQTLPKKPSTLAQVISFNRRTMSLDESPNDQNDTTERNHLPGAEASKNQFSSTISSEVSSRKTKVKLPVSRHAKIDRQKTSPTSNDRNTFHLSRQATVASDINSPRSSNRENFDAMKRTGSVPGNIFLSNVSQDPGKFSLAKYKGLNKSEANWISVDSSHTGDSSIQRRSTIGSSDVRDDKFRILGKKKKRADQNRSTQRHSAHIVFKGNDAAIQEYEDSGFHSGSVNSQNASMSKHGVIKNKSSVTKINKLIEMQRLSEIEHLERTWQSKGNNLWSNMNGNFVELENTDLLNLSESECDTLQKIALQHLADLDLGVAVSIPKDESKALNRKSSMKRKYAMLAIGAKNKGKKEDHVFGIPLVRVVENDQLLRLQTGGESDEALFNAEFSSQEHGNLNLDRELQHQDDLTKPEKSPSVEDLPGGSPSETTMTSRGSPRENNSQTSSSSGTPVLSRKSPTSTSVSRPLKRRDAIGADTTSEINPDQSKLLESLMLSVSNTRMKKSSLLPPTMPQVPYVVQKCCTHIIKYGLHVTGIFRVAGSKKRVRQLREEFDRGVDVKIDEDYNSHDVATLLKEFFRDLPEAIMTKELYQAFLSTLKLDQTASILALRCLVWLLPIPNRDTLQNLIHFLATVSAHSKDSVDANGNEVLGNKMGVMNLATIFGPNILHRNKKTNASNSDSQYQVQSLERAEESVSVIKVIQNMIENEEQLFQIPNNIHDEIFQILRSTDPDAVDFLLRRKAANYERSRCQGDIEKSDEVTDNQSQRHLNNNNLNESHSEQHTFHHDDKDEICHQCGTNNETDLSYGSHDPPLSPSRMGRSVSFTDADIRDILLTNSSGESNGLSMRSTLASDCFEEDENSEKNELKEKATQNTPKLGSSQPLAAETSRLRRQALSFTPSSVESENSGNLGIKENSDNFGKIHEKSLPNGHQTNSLYRVISQPDIYHERKNIQQKNDGNNNETKLNCHFPGKKLLGASDDSKSSETKIRKRLPSTLNLRVHPVYSKNTIRGHPSFREGISTIGRDVHRNCGYSPSSNDAQSRFSPSKESHPPMKNAHRGRRFSKDDMYLVLQKFVEVREDKLRKCAVENRDQRSRISHRTLGTLV